MAVMIPMHMARELAEQHVADLQRMGSAGAPSGKSAQMVRRHRRRRLHDRMPLRRWKFTWWGRRRLAAATEGRPCPG